MRRLSDFAGAIFFVVFGGVMLYFAFREPRVMNATNTLRIEGTLSEPPHSGIRNEDEDYICILINGMTDSYEFTGCSYNNGIKTQVMSMQQGDRIFLTVQMQSATTSYPWSRWKYKAHVICEAYSVEYGTIIDLESYNYCREGKASWILPIAGLIIILIGLFQFFKTVFSTDNIMDTKYLSLESDGYVQETGFRMLKPDRTSYILRNIFGPLAIIAAGVFIGKPYDPEEYNIIGLLIIAFGIYTVVHIFLIHRMVYYVIDAEGVHIRTISYILQPEIKTIRFCDVKEVLSAQGFYEKTRNVGTVKIHTGEIDDGSKVYQFLFGIQGYLDIAETIRKKAGLT